MAQFLDLHRSLFLNNSSSHNFLSKPLMLVQRKSLFYQHYASDDAFLKSGGFQFSLQAGRWEVVHHSEACSLSQKVKVCEGAKRDTFPHIQTLKKFPKEELFRKVVMVRFDSIILLGKEQDQQSSSFTSALSTIKYLHEAGAKVILASNWSEKISSKLLTAEAVAEFLALALQIKVVLMKFATRQMHSKTEDRQKSSWVPVDFGPNSLEAITSLLSKCEKIIWIGPAKFSLPNQETGGASKVAQVLDKLSQNICDITVVGNMACRTLIRESRNVLFYKMIENASVVWAFLKGRKLPGLMALDRAYPFEVDWDSMYTAPTRPLVVDIGSGNGLFLFNMARRMKDLNFLGLEINRKLVSRCLDSVRQSGIQNGYFIATNATSTFRSIVSLYPGELVSVSIQCPNPDFNKPEHRWRMLQRSLIEAIADLLTPDGKVFLQSDIEAVAVRMKELFLKYGKGKLAVVHGQEHAKIGTEEWLKENPFGVRSDWEQHVIDRGGPMYRLMLSKVTSAK